MNISDLTHAPRPCKLWDDGEKIPWNDPAFSQRMLENHLSQAHDWASRRFDIIDRQIEWISSQLPYTDSHIIDLGCGPGFYLQRLATVGYQCTGIDFSPASIEYARAQAYVANLPIEYHCEDIRDYRPEINADLVMLTFGEFNVFKRQDILNVLRKSADILNEDGYLLAEVHCFDEVKRQGLEAKSWEPYNGGLFSTNPHLLVQENFWHPESQVASAIYWVISDHEQPVRQYVSHMQAYTDEQYIELFAEAGLAVKQIIPADKWPAGESFTGKLCTYWLQKAD